MTMLRSARHSKAGSGSHGKGTSRAFRSLANTLSPLKSKNANQGAVLSNGRALGRDGAFRGAARSSTSAQGNNVCIGYSGFEGDEPFKLEKKALGLGAKIVTRLEDYGDITHFITPSPLLRTNKSMAAASLTSNIIDIEWLDKSVEVGRFIECCDYLVADDAATKKKYGISVNDMLENGKHAREAKGILANLVVYVRRNAAGNKNEAPEMCDIKHLVKFAGGTLAVTQSKALGFAAANLLVVSRNKEDSLPGKLAHPGQKGVRVISMANLFDVIFQQSSNAIQEGPNCPQTPFPKAGTDSLWSPGSLRKTLEKFNFFPDGSQPKKNDSAGNPKPTTTPLKSSKNANGNPKPTTTPQKSNSTFETQSEAPEKNGPTAIKKAEATVRSFSGTVSPKSKEDPKTSVETQSAPKEKAATTSKSPATTPTQQRYPDAACQTAYHHFLFGTHLTKSVTRSLTNLTEGDSNRANLGVGTMCIKETYMGLGASSKITCQLHVDGELKLQTFFPDKKDAHEYMWINIEEANSMVWDAIDTSEPETKCRRFAISFNSGPQMFSFLIYGFRGNFDLVTEFLTCGSRFYPATMTGPPHPVVRDVNAMNVEGEEQRENPYDMDEVEDEFGTVNFMSQLY